MQIHQILIRPESGQVIVLYLDQVGNRSNLTFDVAERVGSAKLGITLAGLFTEQPARPAVPARCPAFAA